MFVTDVKSQTKQTNQEWNPNSMQTQKQTFTRWKLKKRNRMKQILSVYKYLYLFVKASNLGQWVATVRSSSPYSKCISKVANADVTHIMPIIKFKNEFKPITPDGRKIKCETLYV